MLTGPVRYIGIALTALSVLFAVYIVATMLYREKRVVLRGGFQRMLRYELALCAAFILFSADLGWGLFTFPGPLAAAGIILRVAAAAASLTGIALGLRVVLRGHRVRERGDILIVLGMALENGRPTRDLIHRLDTALEWAIKHPGAMLVLTGGNASKDSRSEAEEMKMILTGRGLDANRLILEDRSTDTLENFGNVRTLIGSDRPVTVCTNSYHMNRALRIAAEAGFEDPGSLPAPSSPLMVPAHVLWEIIAEMESIKRRFTA